MNEKFLVERLSRSSTYSPILPNVSHLAEMHTFSSKERDAETGLSYFGARYYSSELSLWLSVDPMADKYPSLSPYTYCANNPVKLVDPNGEEIVIFSSDGQQYTYMNGKLINKSTNKEYSGGDAFVDNACEKLNKIRETKTGGAIINDLQEEGYTVNIFKNSVKSHTYPYEDDSGSSILWLESGSEVPTTSGMLANGTISLAHELVHAYDHKHGGDMDKSKENAFLYEGLPRCEWIAVYYENAIRQELYGENASLRNYYSKSRETFDAEGTGPKLLGTDNKPRLAKGISKLF